MTYSLLYIRCSEDTVAQTLKLIEKPVVREMLDSQFLRTKFHRWVCVEWEVSLSKSVLIIGFVCLISFEGCNSSWLTDSTRIFPFLLYISWQRSSIYLKQKSIKIYHISSVFCVRVLSEMCSLKFCEYFIRSLTVNVSPYLISHRQNHSHAVR